MPTYSFKGTAVASNVVFYVEADNVEDAKTKARLVQIVDEDRDGADLSDFRIDTNTLAVESEE